MQKLIDKSVFDWQRGRAAGIQSRGIASLVVAQVKSSDLALVGNSVTSRCVWPTLNKATDSRYSSRRMWGSR